MGFYLYTGNDLEQLADKILCQKLLSKPLSDPFSKERIVVQSRGMAAWLKQHIATNMNICANVDFPFLNKFITEILETSLPENEKPDPKLFSTEIMTWRIYSLLENELNDYPELYIYLQGASKELKQFQLSEKIAETFDQYLIYRPEMIINWENSVILDNKNTWQAKIWHKLANDYTSTAKGYQNFINNSNLTKIPYERIILFGISYMPLIFLDFFKKLGDSGISDVHFFYLNPSKDDWYFNLSEKQIDKYLSKSLSLKNLTEEELYLNNDGNTLLSSYGQAGREFFGAVLNATNGSYEDLFSDFSTDTVLGALQNNILLNNKAESQYSVPDSKKDVSIGIHNCHSRTREVEILYDNILNYIEKTPGTQPRDIIVMSPDISEYASTIKSVFDSRNRELCSERNPLPFSLSDVNIALHSKIIKSFFDILNLNFTKFKMTEIMDILETKAIYQTFNIDDSELDHIRKWIIESGMRWGIDSEHRKQLKLPEFNENSISFAFDRMLLGYALEDNGELYTESIIPYDEIELSTSPLLGNFSCFMQNLIQVKDLIAESSTISTWVENLNQILDTFFSDDNNSYKEIVRIRTVINSLNEIESLTGFNEKISFDIIKYYLTQKAGSEKIFEGFLRGKVTFCTMQPMRTVPAKVICLLGMNEGAFPREERKVGFNIMDKNIRFCDKSKTLEDRYIFLESLLAAKSAFYISYIGNDNKTNEPSQPSIVVCELLDYLKSTYGKDIDKTLLYNERLHGFSEKYLDHTNEKHFTYSPSNLSAAKTLRETPKKRLFGGSLIENSELNTDSITLNDLISFYKNPCKYFITKSLSARFNINDSDIIEETEPIETNPLERYLLNKKIVKAVIENRESNKIYERMQKECALPIGNFGKIRFAEQDKLIRDMFNKVNKNFNNQSMNELINDAQQFNFDVKISNCILTCELDFVQIDSHQFFLDPGKINGKRLLEAWLRHIALCSQYPATTYCLFRDKNSKNKSKSFLFTPIDSITAKQKLSELIDIFNLGAKTPIPFFPNTSFAYAEAEKNKLEKAEGMFNSNDYNQGEDSDFYTKLCFDKTLFDKTLFENNFLEEFKSLSKTVFLHFWKEEKEEGKE
jgi:exodeoxyribonuclease V gamma subunit